MATFSDTIKVTLDLVTKGADQQLSGLRGKVDEAEGSFGKLKAGVSGVGDVVGQFSGVALAGAAAGIGAFVTKGVQAFQDLALEAKNFSVAAGTSIQDASRWIEVSGDLGVGADAVQGAMARLNREAASGKLKAFGIDATDANERLLQTIDYLTSIPDESARAKASFELLGKGGAALAPLLANAKDLRDRLADVSDAKVIDPGEAEDARDLANTMDDLGDAGEDLSITLGQTVVPILAQVGAALVDIIDKTTKAGEAVESFGRKNRKSLGIVGEVLGMLTGGTQLDQWKKDSEEAAAATDDLNDSTGKATDAVGELEDQAGKTGPVVDELAAAQKRLADADKAAAQAAKDHVESLLGMVDAGRDAADAALALTAAQDALTETVKNQDTALAEAGDDTGKRNAVLAEGVQKAAAMADAVVTLQAKQAAANGTTQTAADKLDSWNGNMVDAAARLKGPMRQAVLDYIADVNGIPPEKVSEILADLNPEHLATAKADLAEASKSREMTIAVTATTGKATGEIDGWIHANEAKTVDIPVRAVPVGNARPKGFAPDGGVTATRAAVGLAPSSDVASFGLGAAPLPVASTLGATVAPVPIVVQNTFHIPVTVTPLANKSEVGRAIADALNAFYGTSGTRTIRRAG